MKIIKYGLQDKLANQSRTGNLEIVNYYFILSSIFNHQRWRIAGFRQDTIPFSLPQALINNRSAGPNWKQGQKQRIKIKKG